MLRLFTRVSAAVLAAALGLWLFGTPPDPPLPALPLPVIAAGGELPAPRPAKPPLPQRLAAAGHAIGDPVFLRIIKDEAVLEVWLKRGARFALFETMPVCAFSGGPGPKLKEGDGQSPEGFYEVGRAQLNPDSAYHLAFNLGFPNAYDRAQGRTGSHLMVHGDCVSIGCYAMSDIGIDDIYRLVAAALAKGQRSVSVHAYPFRLTDAALAAHAGSAWAGFWANLKEGQDAFEAHGVPPEVHVCAGRYAFGTPRAGTACARISSW